MTYHYHLQNHRKIGRNLSFDPTLANPNPPIMNHFGIETFKVRRFMKYFPKYLKNLSVSSKTGPFKSKLKRTKIIRNPAAHSFSGNSEWRQLLSNKIKHIKTLYYWGQFPDQFVEKIKLFTELTSIHFYFSLLLMGRPQVSDFEKRNLRKACQKIRYLKNIKHLQFNRISNPYKSLIDQLDDSSRLLCSLKTLTVSCIDPDDELLSTIKNSKNFLKYVTNLELASLYSPKRIKDFQTLENSCPNLTSLSFEFTNRNIIYSSMRARRFSNQHFPVEINYLSALKTFHNLKELCLRVADTFTFLNNFVAPPLIQNLTFNIGECITKEILLRIDSTFNDDQSSKFFEENQTLVKFYSNLQSLHNLETFKMLFSQDCDLENYKYQNHLLQNILKTTPSLTNLIFVGCLGYPGLNPRFPSPVRDSYLPQLLESCHHFSTTLQTLEIGHEKVIFSKFDLNSSRNKFTNLTLIKVTGQFDDADADIYSFLEEIISLGGSLTTIKLNTFIDSTSKSVLSLLQQMNQLKKPNNLKIELQIKFLGTKSPEQLEQDFEDIIKELPEKQKGYSKLQGVSLNIFTSALIYQSGREAKEVLFVYGKKFDHFDFKSGSINF